LRLGFLSAEPAVILKDGGPLLEVVAKVLTLRLEHLRRLVTRKVAEIA
jgi:hypothetical protein